MKFILRLLLSALAVVLLANILPGIHVETYWIAVLVALVLSLLNGLVKPLLVILTLPVTILTLGLFLLVINAIIILLAGSLVSGFTVDGFWWALLFSLLLSVLQSIFFAILKDDSK
ncbi:phage holin family protein [Robiginitalea marina]|uniref:Phage holin family protein n=1 Tax=Robiginitalea marina TaxID=2954105 RepID=A0ABT1AZS9_9FLAO|nr:phage holin family protein [Robiginitalea marina]MCO5724678.1 phage holin family protein [Robiginitalea marina]